MENISLQNLNTEQQEAVLHQDGHLLIVAGPGTGKTHTLATKIVHLLTQKKSAPLNIVAITFTQKAAQQLKNRVEKMLQTQLPSTIFVGTFHAFCLHLLKNFLVKKAAHPLRILSEKEQQEMLRKIIEESLTFSSPISNKILHQLQQAISCLKNETALSPNLPFSNETITLIYQNYQQKLKEQQLYDYDDLMLAALHHLQQPKTPFLKPTHLFVDEYQDLNSLQYQLLRLLVDPSTYLCAIGDPDQAIYSFRGAKLEYFLRFPNDFPNTQTLTLQTSYRSSPNILNAANQLIQHNTQRIHKSLKTIHPQGQAVTLHSFQNVWKEAAFIAKQIMQLVGGIDMLQTDQHHTFSIDQFFHFPDIAILCRTNHQARSMAEALKKENIPYQLVTSIPWHQKNEIQLMITFLQLLADPEKQLNQEFFQKFALKFGIISPPQQLNLFIQNILKKPTEQLNASAWIKTAIVFLNLEERWKDGTSKGEKRWQNLQLLLTTAAQFDHLHGTEALQTVLNYCALLQNDPYPFETFEGVAVMTLHAAKGLEFEVVFIPGLCNGSLPLKKKNQPVDIEEERRLFYVGITRARKQLYLSYARNDGYKERTSSVFLKEIENHLERAKFSMPESKKKTYQKKQMKLF